MAVPFKYYILNEQEIESGALDLRYYTKTQADGKYVLKETGKQLIESTILTDLTDGGNTTLHKHDDKADKIYATNLVTNGDFSNGTTGWSATTGSLTVSNNELTLVKDNMTISRVGTLLSIVNGRKYYVKINRFIVNDGATLGSTLTTRDATLALIKQTLTYLPHGVSTLNFSLVFTATIDAQSIAYNLSSDSTGLTTGRMIVIDLTSLFGAGNEPTKDQIDRLLSIYPNSWFNGTAEITNIKQVFNEKSDRLFATNLVTNGDFSNGTTGCIQDGSTLSASNYVLSSTGSGSSQYVSYKHITTLKNVLNRKIFYRFAAKVTNSSSSGIYSYLIGSTSGQISGISVLTPAQNQIYNFSVIVTTTSALVGELIHLKLMHMYADAATANGKVMEVQYVQALDLTQIFGAGKEPTKEQMDWLLAQKYANSWFDGTKELCSITDLLTLVNTKANSTQEAWITPTLQNGATQFDSTNFPIGYYKDSVNIVRIRGLMNGISASGVVMNLPSGYRPPKAVYFITRDGATNVKRGYIATDGNVYMYYDGTYSAYYLLDGISFRAA